MSERYASVRFSSGIYVFFSNFSEKLTFFILFIFLARYFDQSVYGILTASFAFANILMVFMELGFTFYFQREAAVDGKTLTLQLNHAFSLRLLLIFPFIIISLIYFFFTGASFLHASILLAFAVCVYSLNSVLNAIFLGRNEFKLSFKLHLASRVFLLIAVLLSVLFDGGFVLISSMFALSAMFHLILLIVELREVDIIVKPVRVSYKILKPVLVSSVPIGLSIVFVWVYDKLDILILRQFGGNAVVAVYAVAYSIYKLPQALTGFVFTPLFTDLSKEFSGSGAISFEPLLRRIEILGLIVLVFGAVGYLFANEIFRIIYGPYYAASAPYFRLLLFALPGLLLNNISGTVLNSAKREKPTAQCVFYSALINITLNLALIPHVGIWGAVIATIASEYLTFFFQAFYINKFGILVK